MNQINIKDLKKEIENDFSNIKDLESLNYVNKKYLDECERIKLEKNVIVNNKTFTHTNKIKRY